MTLQGLDGVRYVNSTRGLRAFFTWCITMFVGAVDVQERPYVRGLLKGWDFRVYLLNRRRPKLWEGTPVYRRALPQRMRGYAALVPPDHPHYSRKRLPIVLAPELLLSPSDLGYVFMHELGHALRYAEFQRLGQEMGLPDGMVLRNDANEADAERTADLFAWGVARLAQKKRMARGDMPVIEKFCREMQKDARMRELVERVSRSFGVPPPCV